MKRVALALAAFSLPIACGLPDGAERSEGTSSSLDEESILENETARHESMDASLEEAVAALGEQPTVDASLALEDTAAPVEKDTFQKVCSAQGDGSVVVTLKGEIAKQISVERKLFALTLSFSGSGEQTRVWKQEGKTLACNDNGKSAKVDWTNVDGLSLDLTVKRERERSMSRTNKKKQETVSQEMSFSADGERHVVWKQEAADEVASSDVVRQKTITSKMKRVFHKKGKDGAVKDREITIATAEGAPLVVTVVRAKDTLALKTKTIESGALTASHADGSRIESSFSALKLDFTSAQCDAISGSVTHDVYAKESSEPTKSYKISFEDGVGTLTDLKTGEATEYDAPGCDPEDLK